MSAKSKTNSRAASTSYKIPIVRPVLSPASKLPKKLKAPLKAPKLQRLSASVRRAPPRRRPLTLKDFRKLVNQRTPGSHLPAYASIHVYENDMPRGYDFIPSGMVELGRDYLGRTNNTVIDTTWLRSEKIQKPGEFVYILGMMRDPYDTDYRGRLYGAAERALWMPWSLQVCDGNVLSSNCLNTRAYRDAPTPKHGCD